MNPVSRPVVFHNGQRACATRISCRDALQGLAVCLLFAFAPAVGQTLSSGTIRGTVLDPSGAVVAGATVEIQNPVTSYERTALTNEQGSFELANVPFNRYHFAVSAPGFENFQKDVDVHTSVPIEVKVELHISTETTSVTVQAEPSDLIETTPTAHTDIGRQQIESLPIQNQSTGFSELITNAAPAVSADANGFYHPLGEHADTEIVLDNQPIPDQQ